MIGRTIYRTTLGSLTSHCYYNGNRISVNDSQDQDLLTGSSCGTLTSIITVGNKCYTKEAFNAHWLKHSHHDDMSNCLKKICTIKHRNVDNANIEKENYIVWIRAQLMVAGVFQDCVKSLLESVKTSPMKKEGTVVLGKNNAVFETRNHHCVPFHSQGYNLSKNSELFKHTKLWSDIISKLFCFSNVVHFCVTATSQESAQMRILLERAAATIVYRNEKTSGSH